MPVRHDPARSWLLLRSAYVSYFSKQRRSEVLGACIYLRACPLYIRPGHCLVLRGPECSTRCACFSRAFCPEEA
eukprot:48831-Eustigmatos_ZCMA.PRE.1